jgi:hypothetical protein
MTDYYRERRNAERLAAQHLDVQAAAKDILKQLKDLEQYLYWSMSGEERDGGAYYAQSLLDHAHDLVDQAHAYRAALKASPPPAEEDNDDAA